MTHPGRHPFLDDLTDDVTLISSVIRRPLRGRDKVRAVVQAAGALYQSQQISFVGDVGGRMLLQYQSEIAGGPTIDGLVSVVRNAEGGVESLHIAFSPLDAVLFLSAKLKDATAGEIAADIFYDGDKDRP